MTGSTVWSVGHSNHNLAHFLDLLRGAGIQSLADIRSQPFSRYRPHFNRRHLEAALVEAGLNYSWLGASLGGRPPDAGLYDDGGHVRYDVVAGTERFRRGIDELLSLTRQNHVAMMCSEEDPARCHRRGLVTPVLLRRGVAVIDIRGDGREEPAAVWSPDQAQLFGDL